MKCLLYYFICVICCGNAVSELFSDTRSIHEQVINFYSNNNKSLVNIIPLQDLSQPISVEVTLFLYSVDGFNAVNGQVDISASIYLEWTDETRSASIGNYNFPTTAEGYSVTFSPSAIWTPSIVLLNAVNSVKDVGDESYKVRYLVGDGRAKWQPRAVIQASCSPNVKYYPFDRQDCSFIYTAWGYTTDEIVLVNAQSDWYLCDYTANAVWALVSTSSEEYVKNGQSYVKFKFTIERQPMYFVINVIFPIVLLAFLDGFVFLLPAESGERIGFCVTCFLSFVFMLQTVMGFLPQTAEPMSILCFYVVVMMVASIMQCIVTVLLLRVYQKPEDAKVPRLIKRVVYIVTCVWVGVTWRNLRRKCKKLPLSHEDGALPSLDTERTLRDGKKKPVRIESIEVMKRMSSSSLFKPEPNETISAVTGAVSASSSDRSSSSTEKRPTVFEVVPGSQSPVGGSPSLLLPMSKVDSDGNSNTSSGKRDNFGTDKNSDITDEENEDEIRWQDVGQALDTFFFIGFTSFQIAFTMLYIIPLSKGGS